MPSKKKVNPFNKVFEKALNTLNEAQRQAVEQMDGGVMVIAGPGTGKTQLLAVRVGYILKHTDTNPQNILCLTFTDAGVIAMRNRLLEFIGPEAHNVNIFTFHAFCNMVIMENLEYFGGYRDLQLVSELEQVDIIRQIIDEFSEDHPLKKLKGQLYGNLRNIRSLFHTMKQENWTHEDLMKAYEAESEALKQDPNYFYKTSRAGKFKKGDFNQKKYEDTISKYKKTVEVSKDLEKYDRLLREMNRFDYQDMILWVIDAFEKHENLKAGYQERYHYIMVDEYQDTNGAQNRILYQLADYWDDPNLFVVGDDDQAIYRFQGANMDNIEEFGTKFKPKEIILQNNYRSSQKILDKAKSLIGENQQRLVNSRTGLVKDLIESRSDHPGEAPSPCILQFQNPVQEEVGIVNEITQLQKKGVPLNEIAIIYRNHKNVEQLVRYFTLKEIPINVKKKVNVMDLAFIKRLINLLDYLHREQERMHKGEALLFEIMHYEYFGLTAKDVGAISIYCSRTKEGERYLKWRDVISDKNHLTQAGVKNIDAVIHFSDRIEQWLVDIYNYTVQVLFEKIITESRLLGSILHSKDKTWLLQVLHSFFNLIKTESDKNAELELKDLVAILTKMKENNIEIPLEKVIYNKNGVHFITAHSSKGLEFEHVYIIRANKKMWEQKNRSRGFSFPPALIPSAAAGDIEDDRRLFYVAMTRAKNHLSISFAKNQDDGKEYEQSRFISELGDVQIKETEPNTEAVETYLAELLRFKQGEPELIDHNRIAALLQNYELSATDLNKYLRCPLTFYFENVLRVPAARTAAMGFGNAIHFAMEIFFRNIETSAERKVGSAASLISLFKDGMDKFRSHFTVQEYENLNKHGNNILTEYYDEYHHEWLLPKAYHLEYPVRDCQYNGIPIKGNIDKVAVYDNHVEVTDFKTGYYKPKKLKGPLSDDDIGGDYWRQIVFYKILMDNDRKNPSWIMRKGVMDYIERDNYGKYRKVVFDIAPFEIEIVGKQIEETFSKIKKHEFEQGCEEENCKWCNFVKENKPLEVSPASDADEEHHVGEQLSIF